LPLAHTHLGLCRNNQACNGWRLSFSNFGCVPMHFGLYIKSSVVTCNELPLLFP
jgi:hypothetical protein